MQYKLEVYSVMSVFLSFYTFLQIYQEKKRYYQVFLEILMDRQYLTVCINQSVIILIWLGILYRQLFYDKIRSIEYENIVERLSRSLIDTIFLLSMFRNEFNEFHIILLFVFLTGMKIFLWLSADRLEYYQQSQCTYHQMYRLFLSLVILLNISIAGVIYYMDSNLESGISIYFLFEFLNVMVFATYLLCKVVVHVIDILISFQSKSIFLLYLAFIHDTLRLMIYSFLFFVLLGQFGLPLHLLRELYVSIMTVGKQFQRIVTYRSAVRRIHSHFPYVDAADMRDTTCSICLMDMERGKLLPCGHIFHLQCLLEWIQRRQVCPTCRASIFTQPTPQQRPQRPLPPHPRLEVAGNRIRVQLVHPPAPAPEAQPAPGPEPGSEEVGGESLEMRVMMLEAQLQSVLARLDQVVGDREA